MKTKFKLVELTVSDPRPRHWSDDSYAISQYVGYYSAERATLEEVRASSKLPEDIKTNPHIYELRMSDDGSHKATVEPRVCINFAGSFITDRDLFEDWQSDDKFLNFIRMKYVPAIHYEAIHVNPSK